MLWLWRGTLTSQREATGGSPEDAELSAGNGASDSSVDVGTLVYVDADFASKATDRRSVSGAMVCVAAMLAAWISRTQKCASQSTPQAEYLPMGDGVKEALFANGMLQFLRPSSKPRKINVLEDSEGAIAPATIRLAREGVSTST